MNRAGSAPGLWSRLPHSARTSSTSSAVTHSVSTPSRTSSDNPVHGCIPGIMHDRCHLTERYFTADKQRHWPGTSKWNKIEHRLFSQITLGWRGRPLTSYDVIINTISAVTTRTGLTVTAVLDRNPCPTGTRISDQQVKDIEDRHLTRHGFHGEWNYTVLPVPRPAPEPEPEPQPARPGRAAGDLLNHPALTGMDPADLTALAAALEIPFRARREQRRYLRHGRA